MPAILPTTMPALLGSFPLPFQKFLWKVRDMIKSAVRLSVQDKIYLLGRDGEETRRYVLQLYFTSYLHVYPIYPLFSQFPIQLISECPTSYFGSVLTRINCCHLLIDSLGPVFHELTIYSLNDQHRFLVAVSGHTIHPSIPKENITAIADLGTGTG